MKTQQWKSISENTSEKLPKSATDSEAKTDNSPKPEIENLNQEHDADMMKDVELETRAKQLKVNKEQSSETIVSNKEMTTAKVDNENNDDDILLAIPPVGETNDVPFNKMRTEPFIRYALKMKKTLLRHNNNSSINNNNQLRNRMMMSCCGTQTFGRPESDEFCTANREISCLAEYVIESAIIQKRDISGGQEKMAIPLVNYYDNTLHHQNDKSKMFLLAVDIGWCEIWQSNAAAEEVGYQYRRLLDHVPTGIYECNDAGDEYFAELDYIEVAEQIKEGYESDVEPLSLKMEPYNPELE
ncbi:Histone-lysine N-methyltransferase eggless [Eumeta japonica]|uniref:Histone-lysine N-methyltransferase eggless n=1 Tax=Eumeta variegata TaxID=151549 RepID=A0A4C1TM26_EUMVA|nr:Histone-lysine N-methyltransferase eggless [Eumeta japonica]